MSRHLRIITEVFAPAFLATLAEASLEIGKEPLFIIFGGFFGMLMFAYMFAIIPTLLYTAVMKLWFWLGLRERCGGRNRFRISDFGFGVRGNSRLVKIRLPQFVCPLLARDGIGNGSRIGAAELRGSNFGLQCFTKSLPSWK